MFNFLFAFTRTSSERSSLQGKQASGAALQRRTDRRTNILIERISSREDSAE